MFTDLQTIWCGVHLGGVHLRCSLGCSLVFHPVCALRGVSAALSGVHVWAPRGALRGALWRALWWCFLACALAWCAALPGRECDANLVSLKHGYRSSTPVVPLRDPEHQATGAMLQANLVFTDLHTVCLKTGDNGEDQK